jgi:hypothetical protein
VSPLGCGFLERSLCNLLTIDYSTKNSICQVSDTTINPACVRGLLW